MTENGSFWPFQRRLGFHFHETHWYSADMNRKFGRPWVIVFGFLLFSTVGRASPAAPRIVVLGDSITEGYGVAKGDAYPALLHQKLKVAGWTTVEVIGAGISGATTASSESRLQWHLKGKPDILLIALGGNDGLRGMKLAETRQNLSRIIGTAKKAGVQVLLAGMQIPPNYGKTYAEGFAKLFRDLAKEYSIPLIPFLLEGVGGDPKLNQADGIHPNEDGQQRIAETVFPYVVKLLPKPSSTTTKEKKR